MLIDDYNPKSNGQGMVHGHVMKHNIGIIWIAYQDHPLAKSI